MTSNPTMGVSEGVPTGDWLVQGKVLVCMSSADYVTLQSGKKQETGFFLKELGRPLLKLIDAGYDVVFANASGTEPHMDPMSDRSIWFAGLWKELSKERQLIDHMKVENNFSNPRKFSSLTEEDLAEFCGVMLPGGHAPMTDMDKDADLGRILLYFHDLQKPTGLICHAPIALLSTKAAQPDEPWTYFGYRMTCYSDLEEKVNELMWMDKLPYKVESELRKHGAEMVEASPMLPKVTVDRELITAQGPTSADEFGNVFVEKLNRRLVQEHTLQPQ